MTGKCLCKPCENKIVSRVSFRVNSVQKDMLGFFCKDCIRNQCTATHIKRLP